MYEVGQQAAVEGPRAAGQSLGGGGGGVALLHSICVN